MPVTATIAAVLFLDANISGIKGLGIAMVLIALSASSYLRHKRFEKEPANED